MVKDMRRLNKIYPIHKNSNGEFVIFGEIGSGKNKYTITLANAFTEEEINKKLFLIHNIINSFNTPLAKDVIPEIKTSLRLGDWKRYEWNHKIN